MSSRADPTPAPGRLDHVAILVRDTEEALRYFRDRLGLQVTHQEDNAVASARLTYLDAGTASIQLLEPLSDDAPLAAILRERGEGLHHLCFSADDVVAAAGAAGNATGTTVKVGSGRGRPSAFVPGPAPHGVAIEFTEPA